MKRMRRGGVSPHPVQIPRIDDSDRAIARIMARRSRRIGVQALLDMYREENPPVQGSAESALLEKIAALPELGLVEEQRFVRLWRDTGCEKIREKLILSAMARQFRYLLKKRNVGIDILDILNDAVIATMGRLAAPSMGGD